MQKVLAHVVGVPGTNHVASLRCPYCTQNGTLAPLENVADAGWSPSSNNALTFFAGIRRCPNPDCRGLIFVTFEGPHLTGSYPPEVLDFDPSGIPDPIAASLEEAIKCHAVGAYRGAALLVRRTLEELCEDSKATGKDLKERIAALAGVMTVPADLLSAADQLRLLGNDAAHIEGKVYDSIGKDEATIAIDLAKELLKAAYQYKGLLSRLLALAKPAATPAGP